MRAGLLGQFPAAIPVTVLASETGFYQRAVQQRPGLTISSLTAGLASSATIADANVILDGLDSLANPGRTLRHLRDKVTAARIFALVGNGAHLVGMLNFLAGDPPPAAYPLVAGDLDNLFASGGWRLVDRVPLMDAALAGRPLDAISHRGVTIKVTSAEISERLSTAGFLVIAEPQ